MAYTADAVLKGNRGEWGVIYALCYLLGTGTIETTNEQFSVNANQKMRVMHVVRYESLSEVYRYTIDEERKVVHVEENGMRKSNIEQSVFKEIAFDVFDAIKIYGGRTFRIPAVEEFLLDIGCHRLKPAVNVRPGLEICMFNHRTSETITMLFNVKCMAGARPTLANASGLTYFHYELTGLTQQDFSSISDIPQGKVKNRVASCFRHADRIVYHGLSRDAGTFKQNLHTVDSHAEQVIAHMLLASYLVRGRYSRLTLECVKATNPLDFNDTSIYERAYRAYLWAVFCGMTPSAEWIVHDWFDGFLLINVVGDVLALPISTELSFGNYLMDTTLLETPSTKSNRATAHTGEVKKKGEGYLLTLNLQIRYDATMAKAEKRIRPINIRIIDKDRV